MDDEQTLSLPSSTTNTEKRILFKLKKKVKCPECGTINIAHNETESFPKILVLLQVNQANIQAPPLNFNNISQSQFQFDANSQSSESRETIVLPNKKDPQSLCAQHKKKLEAFCERCLESLCIDCILSDQHKSHEILSVAKASEKQKQQLSEEVTQALRTEEKLYQISSEIKKHLIELNVHADKNKKELLSLYSYIRELINEREQQMIQQIQSNLDKEEIECEN